MIEEERAEVNHSFLVWTSGQVVRPLAETRNGDAMGSGCKMGNSKRNSALAIVGLRASSGTSGKASFLARTRKVEHRESTIEKVGQ